MSFDSLENIGADSDCLQTFLFAFANCQSLSEIRFPKLKQIGSTTASYADAIFDNAFNNCPALTSIEFPSLTTIGCNSSTGIFNGCNKIKKLYMPKLVSISNSSYTYAFANMAALTEIHFAAENEDIIRANGGFATVWGRGAANCTVYFDL